MESQPEQRLLQSILVQLKTSPIQWVEKYIEAGGVVALTSTIASTNLIRKPTNKTEQEEIIQGLCVECIQALMNTEPGMSAVLEERDTIPTMVLLLDRASIRTRTTILFLITMAAHYSNEGFLGNQFLMFNRFFTCIRIHVTL